MRKNLIRILCLLCSACLVSCGGADTSSDTDTDTNVQTDAQTDAETEAPVVEWTPPTREELVETLMKEGKIVADFIRDNGFTYGDAFLNPAINWKDLDKATALNRNERLVSCDRLVIWIMYRAGFTDQEYYHGINVLKMINYCEDHGFEKITSARKLEAGDIVYVNPDAKGDPQHVFLCAGPNQRYDAGSTARIDGSRGPQPFNEPVSGFMFAYRPNAEKMPDPSMMHIFEETDENTAKVSENSEVVHSDNGGDGTHAIGYKYTPGESQYELHMTLSSVSDNNSQNQNASFVGVRQVEKRSNARKPGGIFVAFDDTNEASLYLGCGTYDWKWSTANATLPIPESFATPHKIAVVDTGDVIKYFMYTDAGEEYLICTIRVSPESDQISVRDNSGKLVYAGFATVDESGYFGVWSNSADTLVSDVSIKKA